MNVTRPVFLPSPNRLKFVIAGLLVAGSSLAADLGYDIPYYGGAWAVIHRDNRNSDFAPFPIAKSYAPHHQLTFKTPQFGFNKPTIGLNNKPFLSGLVVGDSRVPTLFPYFLGLKADQSQLAIFLTSPKVDPGVAAATALLGHDGSIYVSDHGHLMKFSRFGKEVWRAPIRGNPISGAHFTPEGDIFFLAWNGWFYVVEPDKGKILVEQNMTPGRDYSADPAECAIYGNSGACAFANTAALDPYKRRIYQMLNLPDGTGAKMVAYNYPSRGSKLTQAWEGPLLSGGSAASITLSPDYRHLYTTDREGNVLAFDGQTGKEVWRVAVGFVSGASPVVSQDGYIMPAANREDEDSHFVIIKDEGTWGRIAFRANDFRPETNSAAGLNNHFVSFGRNKTTGKLKLLVLHPTQGVVGQSDWGGPEPDGLLGVSLDDRGWVYVSVLGTQAMRVFAPSPSP